MGYLALSDETWDQVIARVRESSQAIAIRWAAVRQIDGSWRLEVASVRTEDPVQSRRLEYSALLMGVDSYEPNDAAALLAGGAVIYDSKLKSQLSFETPSQKVRPTHHTTEVHGVYSSRSGWPEYVLRVDLDRGYSGNGLSNLGHLVVPGLPPYPNAEAAVADVVFGLAPETLRRDLNRYLEIRLADRRGRVTRLVYSQRRVQISLEGHLDGCGLRVAWREHSASERWHDIEFAAEPRLSVPTRGLPVELWAFLCSSNGDVLDRHGWCPNQPDERPGETDLSAGLVRRLARDGEGSELEYKLKIGERTTNEGLAKTICAFANGTGGRILLGVDDEGDVQGFAAEKIRDQVTDITRANVEPMPAFSLRSLGIYRRPVHVLAVPPGTDRPYRCRGRVMIRVQATTREATSAEIRAIVAGAVRTLDPLSELLGR